MKPAILAILLLAAAPAAAQDPVAASLEKRIQAAAAKAAPSVVAILVERDPAKEPKPADGPPAQTGGPFKVRPLDAPCSGVIISEDGYVATSYFNVKGDIGAVKVRLADGTEHEATVVGYHFPADVALLKIAKAGLPVLKSTDLTQLKTSMPVLALGRAPDGKGLTLNPGVVSAPGRMDGKGLQVDSKLNYGNAGGALVDLEGRLVGVCCKVDSRYAPTFGQNSGVGLAIQVDKLQELLPDLIKGLKKASGSGRPYLGIQAKTDAPPDAPGVVLDQVMSGSAAELAGLRSGDVIVELDGKRTAKFDELRDAISRKAIGDKLDVKYLRDGKEEKVTVILGERPGE